jgi:hypothetical protein
MASFIFGIVVGAYTGAMVREEYYFPTAEKIQQAFKVYKENEARLETGQQKPPVSTPSAPVSEAQKN